MKKEQGKINSWKQCIVNMEFATLNDGNTFKQCYIVKIPNITNDKYVFYKKDGEIKNFKLTEEYHHNGYNYINESHTDIFNAIDKFLLENNFIKSL